MTAGTSVTLTLGAAELVHHLGPVVGVAYEGHHEMCTVLMAFADYVEDRYRYVQQGYRPQGNNDLAHTLADNYFGFEITPMDLDRCFGRYCEVLDWAILAVLQRLAPYPLVAVYALWMEDYTPTSAPMLIFEAAPKVAETPPQLSLF